MQKNGSSGNFPLASLALLITGFAALLACADVQRWRQQYSWLSEDWPWRLVGLFGGAAIFGGLIGAGFMFKSKKRWPIRLLAPVSGILAGEIGVLILVAPGPIWRTIFAVVVLLGTAVVFRLGAE
jgi:drug/metabolite transporter (DMT)-like permease